MSEVELKNCVRCHTAVVWGEDKLLSWLLQYTWFWAGFSQRRIKSETHDSMRTFQWGLQIILQGVILRSLKRATSCTGELVQRSRAIFAVIWLLKRWRCFGSTHSFLANVLSCHAYLLLNPQYIQWWQATYWTALAQKNLFEWVSSKNPVWKGEHERGNGHSFKPVAVWKGEHKLENGHSFKTSFCQLDRQSARRGLQVADQKLLLSAGPVAGKQFSMYSMPTFCIWLMHFWLCLLTWGFSMYYSYSCITNCGTGCSRLDSLSLYNLA